MNLNNYSTLVDAITNVSSSEDKGICFVEGNDKEVFYSYRELYAKALSTLFYLNENGMKRGHELIFQLKDNKQFVVTFWACILGGIIPVPLSLGVSSEQKLKLFNILKLLNNPCLITGKEESKKIAPGLDIARLLFADEIDPDKKGTACTVSENDIAYIQFSSGSTGVPKGVKLTHRNLLANIYAIHNGIGSPLDGDLFYSWMPLTHDMGLIGFHLTPLLAGWNHFVMPTELFIRNPNLWMRKVSEHKITFTSSPNFGYKYLLKHFNRNSGIQLDLSSLRIIVNGAEQISAELCAEFTDKMSVYGLKGNVIFPVYGLAEASLAVSFSQVSSNIITVSVDRNKLTPGDKISEIEKSGNSVSFVEVGTAVDNCLIRITNDGQAALDLQVGRIQIKGENVTNGYYNNEEAYKKILTDDGWLDTGDLGFFKNGKLYITGRQKDVLFVNGQNYYSHDLERCSEEIDGIELGKIVISGYFDEILQRDKIISFLLYKGKAEDALPLIGTLKKHINQAFGFEIDEVIPVNEISKTTSGKVQRYLMVDKYRNGEYAESEKNVRAAMQKSVVGTAANAPDENSTEQKLWMIWKEVLGHDHFGLQHNFFEIGGNSLKAAEMSAKVLSEFQVELSFGAIFELQTIGKLAAEIRKLPKCSPRLFKNVTAGTYSSISESQKRLYYIWKTAGDSTGYNIPLALKLSNVPDIGKLEAAIREIINRHEILRTSFLLSGAEPIQSISEEFIFKPEHFVVDESVIDDYLKGLIQPFDLAKLPLFRIALIKTTGQHCYLFLDFHHIIADGVSVSLFISELFMIYNGETLAPPAFQYKDYVSAESMLAGSYEQEEEFWLQQFNTEPQALTLPLDYPRPLLPGYKGNKRSIRIDRQLVSDLKAFAVKNNVSMYMLLLAAYNVWLSKYSCREDIVVGVPVDGRYRAELQEMPGMFVNNLAIRSYPEGDKTFVEFLDEVKEHTFKAFENRKYEFGRLVEKKAYKRDMSRNALFDTMFIYQNMPMPDSGSFTASRYFFDPGFSKYDISLEIFDINETFDLYLEYNSSLFKEDTVQRFSDSLITLLQNIIAHAGYKISDLDVISEKEKNKIIYDFNRAETDFPGPKTIVELLKNNADAYPDETALKDGALQYTFKELQKESDKLAALLAASGIIRGNVVGVLMDRSAEFIISILAVLKAGACFLPVDHELPAARIDYMLTDSQASLLLTKSAFAGEISFAEHKKILLDTPRVYSNYPDTPQLAAIHPDDLAYIIYTSGTTGNPKGVMISQEALSNYASWALHAYFKNQKVSMPFYTSVSFDLTFTSIFVPLISCSTIIIYRENNNPLTIQKIIADNKVTAIKLTPSHLKIIKEKSVFVSPSSPGILKTFIVGGENLEAKLADEISQRFGADVEIYNEYGPTEATVGCMIYKFDPFKNYPHSVPIGVPAGNMQIYILDRFLKPVPPGTAGDLYIAGLGLAKGYTGKPELTEQRFIANPFTVGEKMYRSGDIARLLPDGVVEFIERADQQVKINGYRIELAEIEDLLNKQKGVKQAIVTDREDPAGVKYLCGYILPDKDVQLNMEDLQLRLAEKLPYYMIPSFFVFLDEIPLTGNGKVDFAALPDSERKGSGDGAEPENGLEQAIVKIYEAVLNVKELSVHDNFFRMGGDSIKAIQIVSRLHNAGYGVEIKEILRHQTIRQLVQNAGIGEGKTYEQGVVSGNLGLTPIARWFFRQRFHNPHHYNQSVLLKFNKPPDIGLLERAFGLLIKHHDGLRMNYDLANELSFYNNAHLEYPFRIKSATIKTEGAHDRNISFSDVGAELKGSFNIEKDLLIKALLSNVSGMSYLLVTAHHLVVDAVSWRILLEDLYYIYNALEANEEITLPAKTASITDWYASLEQLSRVPDPKERVYWEMVNDAVARIGSPAVSSRGILKNVIHISYEQDEIASALFKTEISEKYNISTEIILITALVTAVAQSTGNNEVLLELESHGRALDNINVSRTVGWFTSLYAIPFMLKGNTLQERINCVKEQVKHIPGNGIGYGLLNLFQNTENKKTLAPSGIRFNYLGQLSFDNQSDLFELAELDTGTDNSLENHWTAAIDIISFIHNGKLKTVINYDPDCNSSGQVQLLGRLFDKSLKEIIDYLKQNDDVSFTPSDFETVDLSAAELDHLFGDSTGEDE